ncbi:MAG TPA: RNase H family protein [archaeon]|nr:RNase H family protein [archaeon]
MDVHTDGSGKTGKYCYVIVGSNKPPRILRKDGITNNEAEYLAVIAALEENKESEINILSDSQLMVKQLKQEYAIKEDRLRELAQKVWSLSEGRKITFTWIPREKNRAGKVLG